MATANQENTAAEQMANFDAVTEEVVAPEQPDQDMNPPGEAQDNKGDDSAAAPDNSEGRQDGGKHEVKDDEGNSADNAGEVRKPKGQRYQKRIDRLTKRAAEAERRAQELEQQLNQGQQQGGDEDQSKGNDNASAGKEPDPSDFDSYDEYLDSLSDWKAGKRQPKENSSQDAPQQKGNKQDSEKADGDDAEFAEVLEDVQAAFDDTRSQHDDFDEVVSQDDLSITRDMVKAMADTDDPGGIAYHLGNNKEEAARIAGLSPFAQAKEIGKVEAMLQAKPPKRGKKTTQAPDPIEPVKGADSSVADPSNMSFDEYETAMNEREMKRGRGFW